MYRDPVKKQKGILLGNLGTRSLTLNRMMGRISEIQKKDPSFNYDENHLLKVNIDLMIKTLTKIKTLKAQEGE